MRAGRAHIAWYKTYVKAAEISNAEAFAAGVRPGEKDAITLILLLKNDSELKKFKDVKGKILSLKHYWFNKWRFNTPSRIKYN